MSVDYLAYAAQSKRFGVPDTMLGAVRAQLSAYHLEPYGDAILKLAQPALGLTLTKKVSRKAGGHRFGGLPDLPKGTPWPADEEGALHNFIAQFNCADLPRLPGLPLPTDGVLSFFTGAGNQMSNPGGLVRYSTGPVAPCAKPRKAVFLDEENPSVLERYGVAFSTILTFPEYDSNAIKAIPFVPTDEHGDVVDRYFDFTNAFSEGSLRIGGYAPFIPNDNDRPDRINLFSMGSEDELDLMFWDAGSWIYMIAEDDLRQKQFYKFWDQISSG